MRFLRSFRPLAGRDGDTFGASYISPASGIGSRTPLAEKRKTSRQGRRNQKTRRSFSAAVKRLLLRLGGRRGNRERLGKLNLSIVHHAFERQLIFARGKLGESERAIAIGLDGFALGTRGDHGETFGR